MTKTTRALLLNAGVAATLLTGTAAWAGNTYLVGKVTITGNRSVSTAQLMAVVQEQPGQKVTVDQILADRDAISKVLEDAHVVGSVKPSIKTQSGKSEIVFAIDDQGVQAPKVTKVAPKLDRLVFDGNVSLTTDALAQATGLKPGDDLTNEKIAAAQAAVMAAYKAAKLPLNVTINVENKPVSSGAYDVEFHVVEAKAKAKKKARDSEDEGFKSE